MMLVNPNSVILKTSHVPDMIENNISLIDRDIKKILDLKSISDHEKAKLYEQALGKYLHGIELAKKSTPLPVNETLKAIHDMKNENDSNEKLKNLNQLVLGSLPKTYREKGKSLLNYLKDGSDLRWNELGEIVFRGETIEKSNISDLLNDALRVRKTSSPPKGWEVFASELRKRNIPLELIGNRERYQKLSESNLSEPDYFSTPLSVRPKKSKTKKNTPNSINWKSWKG